MADKKANPSTRSGAATTAPRMKWDDSNLSTSYANVCNVSSTREEVILLFGVNQSWQTSSEVTVHLQNRVILSPHAAKRLALLLKGVVEEYEKRFGTLELGQRNAAVPSASSSNAGTSRADGSALT